MMRQGVALAAALFILAFVAHPLLAAGSSGRTTAQVAPPRKAARQPAVPQPAPEKAKAETKPEAQSETINPGPKDIKEKSAVYVFLAWLWLTIAILIYVLALKIREADRIFSFHYYRPDQGSERPRIIS
jgi:hypothetical protein